MQYQLIVLSYGDVAAVSTIGLPNDRAWDHATQFSGQYTITTKLYRLPDLSRAYRYVAITGNRKPNS